jgi:hypothetical protein
MMNVFLGLCNSRYEVKWESCPSKSAWETLEVK